MIVPVKVTSNNFFTTYVSLLNPFLKLRNREAEMLEAFLRVHYTNRSHPRVNQLLFSSSTLRSIRESLAMSVASFNMYKFRLRKKEIFIGRSINPLITQGYPSKGKLNLTFSVNIVNSKGDE